jgi:ferric-dicitrate binding protein FerR (iron transport regulator)
MDYSHYKDEDFAADESFIAWVKDHDPEAERFWSIVLLAHPELSHKIERARILVLNLKRAEERRGDSQQIESIWKNIQTRIDDIPTSPERNIKTRTFSMYKVALPFAAVFCIATVWLLRNSFTSTGYGDTVDVYSTAETGFVEQVNETGRPVEVKLSDGTVISLENYSKVKYKENYDDEPVREVYLSGAAFFEVAKDPAKPFIVHSHDLNTEVLGTSFRIQANEGEKQVVVSVKTGKVSVYPAVDDPSQPNQRDGVILLPNQEVSYTKKDRSFDKKLVDDPSVVKAEVVAPNFVFDNAPIKDTTRRIRN